MNILTQSILLIEFLERGLRALVDAEARSEIRQYLAVASFRRWTHHTLIERSTGSELTRIPRQLKRGRTWRNRSLWRPEGHAATRELEKIRLAKAEA